MGMFLFIVSFLLVVFSAYLLMSTLKEERFEKSSIYFVLIAVSLVLIQFEVLSIIRSINPIGCLISNFIVFGISLWFWNEYENPLYKLPDYRGFKNKLNFAFKRDKILFVLFVAFIFCLLISLFLSIVPPTNNFDCLVYHMSRIGFWLQNQTMAHFETSSIRQVIFPVNSEILIMWPMTFIKRDFFAPFVQYLAGIGILGVTFFYLRYLKLSLRRTLWTVLILASLPAFIVEMSSTQTNLILAFFLICSFYLFIRGVKEDDYKAISFSAVAFAISLGVKTTAFFFIPLMGAFFIVILLREKFNKLGMYLILFLIVLIPSFLLLSSYNYILNYLHFGNPFGSELYVDSFKATPSIKSLIANLIRYFLLFIDFTGINQAHSLNDLYLSLKDSLFNLFSLDYTQGLESNDITRINIKVQENYAKFSLLGFLLFLPLVFKNSFSGIKAKKDRKFYVASTGLFTLGFIILISLCMKFLYWNNRYLLTVIVLSAPIFALSYSRKQNFLKIFITAVILYNFFVIPLNIISRPYSFTIKSLMKQDLLSFRRDLRLRNDADFATTPLSFLVNYLKETIPDNSSIGLIFSSNSRVYPIIAENPTWKIYPIRYENLYKKKNYDDYDYIVFLNEKQKEHIVDKKNVKFNYNVENGKIVYQRKNLNDPITLYTNRAGKIITYGEKPTFRVNFIDFTQIPNNFKLIKKIPIVMGDKNKNIKDKYIFNIYKKDIK